MEKYRKIELLEESTICKLYLVTNKITHKEYAMKVIDKSKATKKFYKKDLNLLKAICKVQHTNIIKYEENLTNNKEFIIIMEYCKGKSLLILIEGSMNVMIDRYNKQGRKIPERYIIKCLVEVVQGLTHINKCKRCYHNLKPNNLLIDDRGQVKIGDIDGSEMDSYKYMSPEQLRRDKDCDIKSDIWALGCVIYSLCTFEVSVLLSVVTVSC
jgi:NIMA (never in mitosis gene a)-related kinase